ncbi:type IV pilus modification protein PilV [Shewanella cyperi]|uniref:type IV pilus modification protein PilV n=1 Tax=Shewanella cyperi TaxID=2814292 RepID=UPI001A94F0AD|nr:type IV pilus modification protein PilV [Shewanella cyperi]QSX41646.1 type IV pilus modification protein PilV [Shewanella cyperi]
MKYSRNGFSLIEVMVSLVILVIGLIGIFNLHTVAKQSNFESFQQTHATYYANDIINRMRLNRTQLAGYAGTYNGSSSAPAKPCIGTATVCTLSETKDWDLYQWQQLFLGAAEISGGKKVGGLDTPIACIGVAGNDVTVVITWRGIRTVSDAVDTSTTGLAATCGTKSDRRRVYVINTVII